MLDDFEQVKTHKVWQTHYRPIFDLCQIKAAVEARFTLATAFKLFSDPIIDYPNLPSSVQAAWQFRHKLSSEFILLVDWENEMNLDIFATSAEVLLQFDTFCREATEALWHTRDTYGGA